MLSASSVLGYHLKYIPQKRYIPDCTVSTVNLHRSGNLEASNGVGSVGVYHLPPPESRCKTKTGKRSRKEPGDKAHLLLSPSAFSGGRFGVVTLHTVQLSYKRWHCRLQVHWDCWVSGLVRRLVFRKLCVQLGLEVLNPVT